MKTHRPDKGPDMAWLYILFADLFENRMALRFEMVGAVIQMGAAVCSASSIVCAGASRQTACRGGVDRDVEHDAGLSTARHNQ